MTHRGRNSSTSCVLVYSVHLVVSFFRNPLHLLRNPHFLRYRREPLLPQLPPTLTKPMLALPKRTALSRSPRKLTRWILIIERSNLLTSNDDTSSSRGNVHFRVFILMPLVRRGLKSCSKRPDHEQFVSSCAGAEQVGNELVRCQESRDGL